MSTETGDAKIGAEVIGSARQQIDAHRDDWQQLDMLDPVSPEDMLDARSSLGSRASNQEVLAHARARKRGRPPGAVNKRTDDLVRYLLQFGQHPAITLMQIQSTPAEVLVENSRRLRRKRRTATGIEVDVMQTMSYEAALSLKARCSDILLPYFESKRPVAVDLSFAGLSDLIIAGETHSEEEVKGILDAEFAEVDDQDQPE